MKYFTILITFLFSLQGVVAQSSGQGEALFKKEDFAGAAEVYKSLLRRSPSSALYNYRYARCLDELGNTEKAIYYFEKAGERYALRNFYLGELYTEVYRFDEAIEAYEKYVAKLDDDDDRIPSLEAKMEKAALGARYVKRVDDIVIVDSVLVLKDDFLKYYRLSQESGRVTADLVATSDSTEEVVVSYTTQRGDRMYVPKAVNGQLDIHYQYKLMDKWATSHSLSSQVNTKANENFPFFLSDGVTLYFASDRDESLGGYDIFITRYNVATDSYLTPENVGMPFNSMANDYMMAIDEVNNLGWWATDRHQDADSVMIYTFVPNEVKRIVKSEDAAYVARVARMATYRVGAKPQYKNAAGVGTGASKGAAEDESDDSIDFFVHDGLVYQSVSEFESKRAALMYHDYRRMGKELAAKRESLDKNRALYGGVSAAKQQELANEIIALEAVVMTLDEQYKNKEIEIRNEEINYLSKKLQE